MANVTRLRHHQVVVAQITIVVLDNIVPQTVIVILILIQLFHHVQMILNVVQLNIVLVMVIAMIAIVLLHRV